MNFTAIVIIIKSNGSFIYCCSIIEYKISAVRNIYGQIYRSMCIELVPLVTSKKRYKVTVDYYNMVVDKWVGCEKHLTKF